MTILQTGMVFSLSGSLLSVLKSVTDENSVLQK